jgi:type IV secretion system protein VirD4
MNSTVYEPPELPRSGFTLKGLTGAICFCALCHVAATEVIVWKLARAHFSLRGLGIPLFSLLGVPFYAPWLIYHWLHLFWRVADPSVHRAMLTGATVAIGGTLISLIFLKRPNRMRDLGSQDLADLHGSARFANEQEIRDSGLIGQTSGVYVGGWKDHYLRDNTNSHVLAIAPTRSGKGVSLVIPTLLAWDGSAIVYDIKGENYHKTAGWRSEGMGGVVFRFAPGDPESSSRFNPLEEIALGTDLEVPQAERIAETMVADGIDRGSPHWHLSAGYLLTGQIIHACYCIPHQHNRPACMADVANMLNDPDIPFTEVLLDMRSYPHMEDGSPHPIIRRIAQDFINREESSPGEFSGVYATVKTQMQIFTLDPLVARYTRSSDFRAMDLMHHARPVTLYVVISPNHLERLKAVVRIVFTVITDRLTDDLNRAEHSRYPLLLMMDEFPTLQRLKIFAKGIAYLAGYRIRAYLIAQEIKAITDIYGEHQQISGNCHIKIAYTPYEIETARRLEQMLGNMTVIHPHVSHSGDRWAMRLKNVSTSYSHTSRPLVTAEEIMRLRMAKREGADQTERITEPGEALIFAGGQRPIRGVQMLYFQNPEFLRRASFHAPTTMVALHDGYLGMQQPIRTDEQQENTVDATVENDGPVPDNWVA